MPEAAVELAAVAALVPEAAAELSSVAACCVEAASELAEAATALKSTRDVIAEASLSLDGAKSNARQVNKTLCMYVNKTLSTRHFMQDIHTIRIGAPKLLFFLGRRLHNIVGAPFFARRDRRVLLVLGEVHSCIQPYRV